MVAHDAGVDSAHNGVGSAHNEGHNECLHDREPAVVHMGRRPGQSHTTNKTVGGWMDRSRLTDNTFVCLEISTKQKGLD